MMLIEPLEPFAKERTVLTWSGPPGMFRELAATVQDLIFEEISGQSFGNTVDKIVKANYKYDACSGFPDKHINSMQIVKVIDFEAFKIRKKVLALLGHESSWRGVEESVASFTAANCMHTSQFRKSAHKITDFTIEIIRQAVLDVEKQGSGAWRAGTVQKCEPGRLRDTVLEASVLSSLLSTRARSLLAASAPVHPTCRSSRGIGAPILDSSHRHGMSLATGMGKMEEESDRPKTAVKSEERSDGGMSSGTRGEASRRWRVIGGTNTGGLLVRAGAELNSPALKVKLGTGAIVEELELNNSRLHFEKLSGDGPDFGWVSIEAKNSRLCELLDSAQVLAMQEWDSAERMRHLSKGRKVM